MELVYHRPEWTEKRITDDLAMFALLKNLDPQCPCFLKIIMNENSTMYSVGEAGEHHDSMHRSHGWPYIDITSGANGRAAPQSTGSTSGKGNPDGTRRRKRSKKNQATGPVSESAVLLSIYSPMIQTEWSILLNSNERRSGYESDSAHTLDIHSGHREIKYEFFMLIATIVDYCNTVLWHINL